MPETDSFGVMERLWQLVNRLREDDPGSLTRDHVAALRQLVAEARHVFESRRLQRDHYRTLIDQSPDAILVADANHFIIEANQQACLLLGYRREELLQRQMRHLIPVEDWNSFQTQLNLNNGALRERRMLRRDTSPVFVEAALVLLDEGRYRLSARDITDRKQNEAARCEHETRLQAIVASLDDILFEFDADGTYINVQARNEADLGQPAQALLGRTVSEVLDPVTARRMLEAIRRTLKTGQPESFEYPVHFPDHTRWYLARLSPLLPASSFVKTVIVLARDITARKQAEEQLAQNAAEIMALYRAATQLLGPAADVTGLAGHIAATVTREFDVVACNVLLLTEKNTLRRIASHGAFTFAKVELPLDGPGLTVAAFQSRKTVYAPDVLQDPRYLPGTPETRSELAVPLKVGDRVIGVLDLQSPERDAFSERARHIVEVYAEQAALALENAQLLEHLERARAAAEEANRLKSMFLANTSHELRTPLAVIMGALDAVLNGLCTPEDQPQLLATAHAATRRLQFLIHDLLDFAMIEAGRLDLTLGAIDVLPILAEVYMFMRQQAEAKKLRLNICLPSEPPPLVWADAIKVEQILLNLVGNAVKFTEQGSVTVSVETDWGAPRALQITVQDTGIGIPLEKQGTIFQPFVQVDGSSTRRYGGAGLGLSLSRRLAELMGGTLHCYSAGAGQGSRFTLRLPLAEDAAIRSVQR
ncbi:MAG: PAS domain S-box protein [Anaerolineales bacterium]|nr:PAS domain S-box protein [Anaerolineales bacterium]